MSVPCPPLPQSGPTSSQSVSEGGFNPDRSFSVVVSARLYDTNPDQKAAELIARASDWPQPYRLLDVPSSDPENPPLDISVRYRDGGAIVRLAATRRPLKCVVLSLEPVGDSEGDGTEADVEWSDNGLDLVPDDPREIQIRATALKLGGMKLQARFFGGVQTADIQ